jgi:hypothetical protein
LLLIYRLDTLPGQDGSSILDAMPREEEKKRKEKKIKEECISDL